MTNRILSMKIGTLYYHSRLGGWGSRDEAAKLYVNKYECLAFVEGEEYSTYDRRPSRPLERNIYQESAMELLGGGEKHQLGKTTDNIRIGGGLDDIMRAVKRLDCPVSQFDNKFPPEYYVRKMGGSSGILKPIPLDRVGYEQKQNTSANPGPTYKDMGFKTKGECLPLAINIARTLHSMAEKEAMETFAVPRYAMSGRPVKLTKTRAKEKLKNGELLGRAVFMADAHEAIVAARFVVPLTNWAHDYSNGLYVGFNKFSADPTKIVERLKKFSHYINGDFSAFDSRIGPGAIIMGFKIIRILFGIPKGTDSADSRILDWLENQLVNTPVVLPTGRTVITRQGLPSGSGFTAIIGTIINFVFLTDALSDAHISHYHLGVQGDDNAIAYNGSRRGPEWDSSQKDLVSKMAHSLSTRFNAVYNPHKCHFADKITVGFATPNAPEFILNGSSTVLRRHFEEKEKLLGRKLYFNEKWIEIGEDPSGPYPGLTHRWTNLFHRRMKFLSHYFKEVKSDGGSRYVMVRPTPEIIEGLVSPEHPVATVSDQIARLQSALVEHYDNSHAVNHIMHYYYDAWVLENSGISTRKDLKVFGNIPSFRQRVWYRKVEEQVDLLAVDPEFYLSWKKFTKEASSLREAIYNTRAVEWSQVRNLRRGRLLLTSATKVFRLSSDRDFESIRDYRADLASLGQLGITLWTNRKVLNDITANFFISTREGRVNIYERCFVINRNTIERLRGVT